MDLLGVCRSIREGRRQYLADLFPGRRKMLLIPAPMYSLTQAAWIPRITVRCDDDKRYLYEGRRRGRKMFSTSGYSMVSSCRRLAAVRDPG